MGCFVVVPESNVAIVENCGGFDRIVHPGCHCLGIPGICNERVRFSTRIRELCTSCETKTRDNVFVWINVVTQFRVISSKCDLAAYKLDNPKLQITTYVLDVVRASVPKLNLDEVFESKDDIAKDIHLELREEMEQFGFEIVAVLVIDIKPNDLVRNSMNEIQAQRRLRLAAEHKAEANKILVIKHAEAISESQYLAGVGLAKSQQRIVECLETSVIDFHEQTGTSTETTMDLLLVTQYFDTLKDISAGKKSRTIFVNDEASTNQQTEALRSAFLETYATHS